MYQEEVECVNVRGVNLSKEVCDRIAVSFPVDSTTHSFDDFISARVDRFADELAAIVSLREMFATSGAMRWSWSQEARLGMRHTEHGFYYDCQ